MKKPSAPVGWRDAILGLPLFAATAAVVLWQNARVGVLWDLSYILENAWRISLGQVPYRDFPLPYPPLTFFIQAALIKLTGRVVFHHFLYSAVAGGLGTWLTFQILLHLLRGSLPRPRLIAFLLSAPLAVLGIYCIFPHPFYDCDCTLAMLACVLLLLRVEAKGFAPVHSLLIGMTLVVPPLVKQNAGLAFLASAALAIAVWIMFEHRGSNSIRGHVCLLLGIAVGAALAALLIHFTAGLGNYLRWTIQYAAARRMPSLAEMFSVYHNRFLWWWLPSFAAGALLLSLRRPRRWSAIAAAVLLSLPFAWPSLCLLTGLDSSDQADCLLALWPLVLIVGFVFSLRALRQRRSMVLLMPFILIGAVHGAFLSQQLWGSTYAIWPLAIILIASTLTALPSATQQRWVVEVLLPLVIALSLTISGGHYAWSHERLDYANVSEGPLERSALPALRGLRVRGPWLPQLDELVGYADAEIPKADALLIVPGEDPFYYATGREPRFPVLMFDHTVNPYSAEEIVQLARARNVRWLVLKRDLQLEADPLEDRQRLLELLRRDFILAKELDNYDVYRRSSRRLSRYSIPPVLTVSRFKAVSIFRMASSNSGCWSSRWRRLPRSRCASSRCCWASARCSGESFGGVSLISASVQNILSDRDRNRHLQLFLHRGSQSADAFADLLRRAIGEVQPHVIMEHLRLSLSYALPHPCL